MLIYAVVIAGAVLLGLHQPAAQPAPDQPPDENTDQLTTPLEDFEVIITPDTYTPAAVTLDTAAQNEKAFLDMLAYSEGVAPGEDGYRTLFGGALMSSLADHPRQFFSFTNSRGETLRTSAAGRYQFLMRTWDTLARRLNLPDFGPASQDAAALELVRERGAQLDVQAGRIQAAITKCAPIWASLPGAGYAQPERKLSTLLAQFSAAGGNMEA